MSDKERKIGKVARGTAAAALGFVSTVGMAGLAEADVQRVENDIQTLRAVAQAGAIDSHPVLASMTPTGGDLLPPVCHSNSYSQSVTHNQGHGQTYSC